MKPFQIPFYRHDLGAAELESLSQALADPILTTGARVAEFERRFSDYVGCQHTLAVTSCTGGLHLALMGLGIGPGDEVITTPMSFIATATAIEEAGATPVFVDVEDATGNIDVALIEEKITARTKAIIPVHLYGAMCDMKALRSIADKHDLSIVEDSAHCVEGQRDGIRPGQLSDAACFSFYATKNLTCGEGGAVITNDGALQKRMKLLSQHGMDRTAYDRANDGYRHWDMVMMGWKYNMSNIEAALLLPQLNRLDEKYDKRAEVAAKYLAGLSCIDGIRLPSTPAECVHSWHLFTIWSQKIPRDDLVLLLRENGIESVVNYRPIHLMTWFREAYEFQPGDYPIAERIGEQTISLPFYPDMSLDDVDAVCMVLNSLFAQNHAGV